MKNCTSCKQDLPISKFHKNKARRDGLNSRCRDCSTAAVRLSRQRIKAGIVSTRGKKDEYTVSEKRNMLMAIKQVPCLDCGNIFPSVCMDFDHLPQYEKSFNIANSYLTRPWTNILAEIAKCEIVCSNCHRIRTAARR